MADTLRSRLSTELDARKRRNPYYSLRAFARDLGIGLGSLSEVMSGKRELSNSNFQKVTNILGLSDEEKIKLRDYKAALKAAAQTKDEHQYLAEDEFRLIADWYHLAILNLAKLRANRASADWIADRLQIETYQALDSLERLQRLNLLKIEKGKLVRTARPLSTTHDLPSAAIRKHHSQNLLLAEKSLSKDPVEVREFASVTMAVNPRHLPKVKELLTKTRKKVADLLEDEDALEVYTLSFQLFPLTKGRKP